MLTSMALAQGYLHTLIALIIVCGTCVMSFFLLQPVKMVQPSILRRIYRIVQVKTFSTSISYSENLCLPKRRQAYFDVLESSICGDSTTDISIFEDICSVDTNGVPCGTLYYRSLEDLASLDSNCSTSNVSCTSNCKDGIIYSCQEALCLLL